MTAADAQFESWRMNIFIWTYFHITAHFFFSFKQRQRQKNPIMICQGSKSFNMTRKTSSFGCCTSDRSFWHQLLIVFVKKNKQKICIYCPWCWWFLCVCVFWSLQLFCLSDGGKQDQHDDRYRKVSLDEEKCTLWTGRRKSFTQERIISSPVKCYIKKNECA